MNNKNQTSISKKQRAEVYAKSDGHCWYCGCGLPNRWHVDHVIPVIRSYEGEIDPCNMHLHQVDNFVPSCPPCNLFKSSSTVEQFRSRIGNLTGLIREYSVKFRNAERFNMIMEMHEPVIFWFEKSDEEKEVCSYD